MVEQKTEVESVWETEKDEASKPEYQAKAHLVLEGSEQHEWGLVKDCHGCINYVPEDAEIVGTWSKYSEGTFWVSLETAIQALQDRATILTAELAERRKLEPAPVKPTTTRRRKEKVAPEPEETTSSALDQIRAKLKGS